jgi:hypothetical protein
MLKTAWLLQAYSSFKHAFMMPYDPYGLQLLVQDIYNYSIFQKVVKQANEIITYFKGFKSNTKY